METTTSSPGRTLWRRLVWFAALWAGSILALGAVATILKAFLKVG
ncbi:MAG: DUF2474 domain-containing protein [Hansschlegelia sp.]